MNENNKSMGFGNHYRETPWDKYMDGVARNYLCNDSTITGILKRIDTHDGNGALFFSPCLIFDSHGFSVVSFDEARRLMETEPVYNPVPVYDPDPVKNLHILAERHNAILRKRLESSTEEEKLVKPAQWYRQRGFNIPYF
jgi:hypothetical protein